MIDYMIGRTDKFAFEIEHGRYQPEIQKVVRAVPGGNNVSHKSPEAAPSQQDTGSSVHTENLYKEIEKLRATVKAKDQTISQLSRIYREVSQREKEERLDTELGTMTG